MALVAAVCSTLGCCIPQHNNLAEELANVSASGVRKADYSIDTNVEDFYDENVVTKLPSTVSPEEEISIIVSLKEKSVIPWVQRTAKVC